MHFFKTSLDKWWSFWSLWKWLGIIIHLIIWMANKHITESYQVLVVSYIQYTFRLVYILSIIIPTCLYYFCRWFQRCHPRRHGTSILGMFCRQGWYGVIILKHVKSPSIRVAHIRYIKATISSSFSALVSHQQMQAFASQNWHVEYMLQVLALYQSYHWLDQHLRPSLSSLHWF